MQKIRIRTTILQGKQAAKEPIGRTLQDRKGGRVPAQTRNIKDGTKVSTKAGLRRRLRIRSTGTVMVRLTKRRGSGSSAGGLSAGPATAIILMGFRAAEKRIIRNPRCTKAARA